MQVKRREIKQKWMSHGSSATWRLPLENSGGGSVKGVCPAWGLWRQRESLRSVQGLVPSTWGEVVSETHWSWLFETKVERENLAVRFCQNRIKTVTRKRKLLMKGHEPFSSPQKSERKMPLLSCGTRLEKQRKIYEPGELTISLLRTRIHGQIKISVWRNCY